MDSEVHGSFSHLQTDYYQELYRKYPHAFRKRLEAREAGRRLFNQNKPQVRFRDEIEVSDYYEDDPYESLTDRPITNWDKEVGHYFRHKSLSRDCITSIEPSECSGSMLSVTQRLRINSDNLNKLLYESSPLRRYQKKKETVQYDSGTENEQTLQDYMLEKSKERSRHRKKQRVIIQRKLNTQQNGDSKNGESNKENNIRTRRWLSKSASPTAKNRSHLSLSTVPQTKRNQIGNVNDLLAESDLKIDTLLEKISLKMVSPDSPPDSAIDIETPSVQSLVVLENQKGSKLKTDPASEELSNLVVKEDMTDALESSPGSTASACVRKNSNKQNDQEKNESLPSNEFNHNLGTQCEETAGEIFIEPQAVAINTQTTQEINEISKTAGNLMLENCKTTSENDNTGPGLLQLCSDEMGFVNDDIEKCSVPNGGVNVNVKVEASESDNQEVTDNTESQNQTVLENKSSTGDQSIKHNLKDSEHNTEDINDSGENLSYQGDDEGDIEEMIVMDTRTTNECQQKQKSKDSDVDSGIGQSSTCTDAVPPKPRGTTMKLAPVKADHSILPLRSDIDIEVMDEVAVLKKPNRRLVKVDSLDNEDDDTGFFKGNFRESGREKKLEKKFKRSRSPSPYTCILLPRQQPARPKSAPTFVKSDWDLRIVDIPLSNENSPQKASKQNGDVNSHNKGAIPKKQNPYSKASQKSNLKMKYASTSDLYTNEKSVPNSRKSYTQNHMSSTDLAQQGLRKHSIASLSSKESSISSLSDSDTETITQIQNVSKNLSYSNMNPDHHVTFSTKPQNSHGNQVQKEHVTFASKKGTYQPSVSSPRVREKRLKLKNILKNKKGSFQPTEDDTVSAVSEKTEVNRIYAKNRGGNQARHENGDVRKNVHDYVSMGTATGSRQHSDISDQSSSKWSRTSPVVKEMDSASGSCNSVESDSVRTAVNNIGVVNSTKHKSDVDDTKSVDNFLAGADFTTVAAKPVILDSECQSRTARVLPKTPDSDPGSVNMSGSPKKAQPPKKPARKKQKNLPSDLNLSKYKITAASNPELNRRSSPQSFSSAEATTQSEFRYPIHAQEQQQEVVARDSQEPTSTGPIRGADSRPPLAQVNQNSAHQRVNPPQPDEEIEVLQVDRGNLNRSREISASKSSLFNKTKGKLKKFKKALSLEQGIDKCGVEPGQGNSQATKVKKAPSLKSITSLFKRKKKKGKMQFEDDNESHYGSVQAVNNRNPTSLANNKQKQWSSCHTLTAVDPSINSNQPTTRENHSSHPIGKLQRVNPDGTQVIQLKKPEDGPVGFFIAKGSAKYGNGIFVSRFSANRPQQNFAGLLAIGDEILEVNGHHVCDLSQDSVYNLISASPIIVLKVLPFIARKDV